MPLAPDVKFPTRRRGTRGSRPTDLTGDPAFLRCINVGGHNLLGMAALRQAFESLGFVRVKTLLAIGADLCPVPTLKPQWGRNLRQMDVLEREFGKRITTRSWNTVGERAREAPRVRPLRG